MSLLVIFGAGASYDSAPALRPPPDFDDRPPLAKDLFADRAFHRRALDLFPECWAIVPRLRAHPGPSLELRLEEIQSEVTPLGRAPDAVRLQQLAAVRFYLQTLLFSCEYEWGLRHGGITNYRALLEDIRYYGNDEVALVTFNYDRMLERAAEAVAGVTIRQMADYLSLGRFAVFKIHGSVNWGREVLQPPTPHVNEEPHITRTLIAKAGSYRTSDLIVLSNANAPIVRDVERQMVLLPAVAVPVQTKQQFECPVEHLHALKARLRTTTRILIIGWQGLDDHFVQLMRAHVPSRPRLEVVAGDARQASGIADRLAAAGLTFKFAGAHDWTFTRYVEERAGIPLLSSS
jgi:hypothetical protein